MTRTFIITIRDFAHFHAVVSWLNKQLGYGAQCWTMDGRVRKHLNKSPNITRPILIYDDQFNMHLISELYEL